MKKHHSPATKLAPSFKCSAATLTLATALAGATAPSVSIAQEYRWVADVLYVPLRSGKGNQYKILNKGLRTGTRLEFISQDDEGGWTEVRSDRGEMGYIRSQYLLDTPTASQQLESVKKQLARVEKQYSALKNDLGSANNSKSELSRTVSDLEKQNQRLNEELVDIKRISADAVALHERHQTLMHDHQLIQTELDVLKAENERLNADSRNTFFLYGALAVGLGALIAWIAPSLRRKKRFSEWA